MKRATLLFVAALLLASCGGGGKSDAGSGSSTAPRPESPATIKILSPKDGGVIKGSSTDVKMDLQGGRVVDMSVTKVTPTTGHIHLQLDGKVVAMAAGLDQQLDGLKPGTHTLRIEFVAGDHLPFDPPVFDEIAFTVK